jgi:Domain of unknown function (DUF397)
MEGTGMNWRKSTYSDNGGLTCVETASDAGNVLVRDTKNREAGTLEFTASAWSTFLTSVR